MTQRLWKCRAVDAEENQNQVSLGDHRPWKSLRDSHIPTASMTAFVPLAWAVDTKFARWPGAAKRGMAPFACGSKNASATWVMSSQGRVARVMPASQVPK